jgi:plasmid stabilization system protein ParE
MRIRYRAQALADLEEIYRYLEPRSPAGARNVLRAIQEAIKQVGREPFSAVQTSDPRVRVKVLGHYRYKIFYDVTDVETIEIVHVRHTARRPWP